MYIVDRFARWRLRLSSFASRHASRHYMSAPVPVCSGTQHVVTVVSQKSQLK